MDATCSYDDLYRLTSATYPGPTTMSYAFDASGNRTSMTVVREHDDLRLRRQRPDHERDAAEPGAVIN